MKNVNRYKVFKTLFFLILAIICIGYMNIFVDDSIYLVLSFLLFNIVLSFFSKEISQSIPVIILKITGTIRYIILPILMRIEGKYYDFSTEINWIMIFELIGILIGISIFYIRQRRNSFEFCKDRVGKINSLKFGLSILLVLGAGSLLILKDKSVALNFLNFSSNKLLILNENGAISLILSTFFFIMFVFLLDVVKNKFNIPEPFKVIISITFCLVFINGMSITGDNVSRWTIIITAIISYTFMSNLYPNYRKKLLVFLIFGIIITLVITTLMKFGSESYKKSDTLKEQVSYEALNAYFSGTYNMQIGLDLINDINNSNLSRTKIFFSDFFGNLPLLNKYLSDSNYQTSTLFNYQIYHSSVARDQIIPLSIQLYIFFNIFFVFFEALIVYLSLYFYFKAKEDKEFIDIYCDLYLSFFLSLVFCINFSIIMQVVWINVLPLWMIKYFNLKISKKRS